MSDKPYEFIETEDEPSGTTMTDAFDSEDVEVENLEEFYPEMDFSLGYGAYPEHREIDVEDIEVDTDTQVDEALISTEELIESIEGQQSNNNNGNNDVYTGKCRGVIASIINRVTSFFGDNQ